MLIPEKRSFQNVFRLENLRLNRQAELILDSQIFPKSFVLQSILSSQIYNRLISSKPHSRHDSNLKLYDFFAHKTQGCLAARVCFLNRHSRLYKEDRLLRLANDKCQNHLYFCVFEENQIVKFEIKLAKNGHKLDLHAKDNIIFVFLNEKILVNNLRNFKDQILRFQVDFLWIFLGKVSNLVWNKHN